MVTSQDICYTQYRFVVFVYAFRSAVAFGGHFTF